MRRSSAIGPSPVALPRTLRSWPGLTCSSLARVARSFDAATLLATVPPCNQNSKENVQSAERGDQHPGAPRGRGDQCDEAGEHERRAHEWNDGDRIRTG